MIPSTSKLTHMRWVALVLLTTAGLASTPVQGFDHDYDAWNTLLTTHVDRQGRVDYPALQKDTRALDSVVSQLGAVTSADLGAWNRNQKLAYWINAYNAFTVRTILDHYPLKRASGLKARFYPANSIRQIPGVWDTITWKAGGTSITLADIENVKLREEIGDARLHVAIVCASIGCPNLANHAYAAETIEAQLELEAKKFVRNVGKVTVDQNKKELHLSKIFEWFTDDFAAYTAATSYGKLNGPVSFIAQHSTPATSNALTTTTFSIKWLDYDWSLNTQ